MLLEQRWKSPEDKSLWNRSLDGWMDAASDLGSRLGSDGAGVLVGLEKSTEERPQGLCQIWGGDSEFEKGKNSESAFCSSSWKVPEMLSSEVVPELQSLLPGRSSAFLHSEGELVLWALITCDSTII